MKKNRKKLFRNIILKFILLSCITVFIPSCAVWNWFAANVDDSEVKDLDEDISSAQTRVTRYDKSLKSFGKMLEAYNIQPVRVQSKIISNDTAVQTLPQDVSNMLITGVNKIGKEVVYLPYDPNYVISESTTGGNINRMLPQIVISGGITEFDKDMIEKNRELSTEVQIEQGQWGSEYDQDYGLGYDANQSVSRIALDLHLLEYVTQASISSAQASNAINLRKSKLGWAVGAYFAGCGLSFDYKLKKKQGMYYALRLLVELSVLEVLGKYFDVPYWRCIPGAQEDEMLVTRISEEFFDLPSYEQEAYIKEYLFFHGEDVDRVSVSVTPKDIALINSAKTKYNCDTNTDLFIKLWKTVPITEARKRNRDFARQQRRQQAENQRLEAERRKAEEQIRASEMQARPAVEQSINTQPVQIQETEKQIADAEPVVTKPAIEETRNIKNDTKDESSRNSDKEVPVGFGATDW